MVLSIGFSQQFGEWRWADDTAEFTIDKEAHFVGSAGAYFFFRHKDYSVEESIKYSFYLFSQIIKYFANNFIVINFFNRIYIC